MARSAVIWVVLGWVGYAALPWYGLQNDLLSELVAGSGLVLGLRGAWWLLPIALPLFAALRPLVRSDPEEAGIWLVAAGSAGLALVVLQGFAIGLNGWRFETLAAIFGAPGPSQGGMGLGATLTSISLLLLLCHGLAARGWCRGDAFVVSAIGVVLALITVFVFFPVTTILVSAVEDDQGRFAPGGFVAKFLDRSIWGLDCVVSDLRCGVAWNTLFPLSWSGSGARSWALPSRSSRPAPISRSKRRCAPSASSRSSRHPS
jgi:iron(III) transport system permease protein